MWLISMETNLFKTETLAVTIKTLVCFICYTGECDSSRLPANNMQMKKKSLSKSEKC